MASGSSSRRQIIYQEGQQQPQTIMPSTTTNQLPPKLEFVERMLYRGGFIRRIRKTMPYLQPRKTIRSLHLTNQINTHVYPRYQAKYIKLWLVGLTFGIILGAVSPPLLPYLSFIFFKLLQSLDGFGSICWQFLSRSDVSAAIQSISGLLAIVVAFIGAFKFFARLSRKRKESVEE